MKTHSHSLVIHAQPEQVWRVLADLPCYSTWNRTIRSAEGRVAPGQRLRLRLHLGGGSRPFSPTVVAVRPGEELLLAARLVHPRVLRATHLFRVEPEGDGTRFSQRWEVAGALAGLAWPEIRRGFPAFEEMARDLARAVEPGGAHA
ncbi:MAG TPA: SRPBCC domain-containing protein [Longimicrobium sp.]|nr:SRPBCC domain-containing protein [Longimicrobium sp.]